MVKGLVKNKVVDVRIGENESITVPSGEKWLVTVIGNVDEYPYINLNGKEIARIREEMNPKTKPFVFVEGQTITTDNDVFIHIGGHNITDN
jgi:hypothetical protein